MAAAPSSKNHPPTPETSPQTTESNVSAVVAPAVAFPTRKAPPLPTYASSEQSEYYVTAKHLLNAGDFEGALQVLEQGLDFTKRALAENASVVGSADLHESMAPFHYMYGTTLLYSVEESQDPQQAMMNSNSNDNCSNVEKAAAGLANDDDEKDPATMATSSTSNATPGEEEDEDQQQQQQQDDMEIAWENLESARLILTRMLSSEQSSQQQYTEVWRIKLRDDLAQCQLRIGDLQRWNTQYEMAICDYTAALEHLDPTRVRKRAEIHYNLGTVYLNQVAAAAQGTTTKSVEETKSEEPAEDTAAQEGETAADPKLTLEQLDNVRLKGFEHYYKCAVDFASLIAELAGVQNWSPPSTDSETSATTNTIRNDLKALCAIVQSWKNIPEAAMNSVQLLDELQETVDEAETNETALQEATLLKEQITKAVAAQHDNDEAAINLFDAVTVADQMTNPFGAAVASQSLATVAPQPNIMMGKKKPKKPEAGDDAALPPSKRPKNE